MDINATLEERKRTHGSFAENAKIAQALRAAVTQGSAWREASDVQREALHNILGKIARLVSGDPATPDTWHDIAGYATLAEKDTNNAPV